MLARSALHRADWDSEVKVGLADPEAAQHAGELAGKRDLGSFGAAPLRQSHTPAFRANHVLTPVSSSCAASNSAPPAGASPTVSIANRAGFAGGCVV
jgi:hypothetical protein